MDNVVNSSALESNVGRTNSLCDQARIKKLNDKHASQHGEYVLLVLAACRTTQHHALEYAVDRANQLKVPVLACFGVNASFPGANARSFTFLLQGLREVRERLFKRGIKLEARFCGSDKLALALSSKAVLVVCERAYLRSCRGWRARLKDSVSCEVVQIETDCVVPVDLATNELEPSAAALRPKLRKYWPRFLRPIRPIDVLHTSLNFESGTVPGLDCIPSLDLSCDDDALLQQLGVSSAEVPAVELQGGESHALSRLNEFVRSGLEGFASERHHAHTGEAHRSKLSAYLHFGQISAVTVALAVQGSNAPEVDRERFLDGLLVRRELARNMVHFDAGGYDSMDGLPSWAADTLVAHGSDARTALYSRAQLERARTADAAWNAAQKEMLATGLMHNRLRMYWCKQLLRWHATPHEAYDTAVYLNDRFMLDGRDPNGYMGIAWCFGRHDRPFSATPIFGEVRSMSAGGLEKKIDVAAYIKLVARKCRAASEHSPSLARLVAQANPPSSIQSFFAPKSAARPQPHDAPQTKPRASKEPTAQYERLPPRGVRPPTSSIRGDERRFADCDSRGVPDVSRTPSASCVVHCSAVVHASADAPSNPALTEEQRERIKRSREAALRKQEQRKRQSAMPCTSS